jgi:hypothetical protein
MKGTENEIFNPNNYFARHYQFNDREFRLSPGSNRRTAAPTP